MPYETQAAQNRMLKSEVRTNFKFRFGLSNNVRDHRAGTSDHPFQKHAQVRLRVHHIVIRRCGFYLRFYTQSVCSTVDLKQVDGCTSFVDTDVI